MSSVQFFRLVRNKEIPKTIFSIYINLNNELTISKIFDYLSTRLTNKLVKYKLTGDRIQSNQLNLQTSKQLIN